MTDEPVISFSGAGITPDTLCVVVQVECQHAASHAAIAASVCAQLPEDYQMPLAQTIEPLYEAVTELYHQVLAAAAAAPNEEVTPSE